MARVRILVIAAGLLLLSGCFFRDAVVYGVGTGRRVITADFNGDQAPDVAVAAIGRVSVLLNDGDGRFSEPVNYVPCPTCANDLFGGIAAGDFDGDDAPDIAATDNRSLWILMNNGDGTFGSPVGYEFLNFSFADGVTAADLDGDGDTDVATAAANPVGSVTVWRNNGDGTFNPVPDQYAVDGSARDIAAGNLNGDTAPDLAVTSFGRGNVAVLLNNGDGSFTTATNYAVGDTPTGVAIGDLNGDTVHDLVAANLGSNTVSVLLGAGDGSFRAAVDYEAGDDPAVPTIASLVGHRAPDIAVANTSGPRVTVLVNEGHGTFRLRVVARTYGQSQSVASADLNADGRTDLAVGISTIDSQGGLISILLHR